MHTNEQKWRANIEKVAFAKAFPGLLGGWGDAIGKGVRDVVVIDAVAKLEAVIFTDDTFIITSHGKHPEPADLLKALAALRSTLGERYAEAYARLDDLAAADLELTRMARMENILGAIRNNIAQIPELYEEIPRLLEKLKGSR